MELLMSSQNHQKRPESGFKGSRNRLNHSMKNHTRSLEGISSDMLIDPAKFENTSHDRTRIRNRPRRTGLNIRTTYSNNCHILFILITILTISMSRISQSALTITNRYKLDPRNSLFYRHANHHVYPRTINNDVTSDSRINRQSLNVTDESNAKLTNTNNNRLALIQNQLVDLKRQLEVELRVAAGSGTQQQVALGSACLKSVDCQRAINYSHCDSDNFICTCQPHHIQYNSTTCLPPSLIGFECLIDAQCQQKVADSVCSSGRCDCAGSFVPYRKDKCLQPSKVNDYCLSDRQCQINDKHSFCKWKIPHVYGLCKCPPNYKIVEHVGKDNSTTSTGLKCVPRLGDTCLNDEECLIATRDSVCVESEQHHTINNNYSNDHSSPPLSARNHRLALRLGDGWPTSGASSRRCRCARGFTAAPNKLDCVRELSDANELVVATQKPPSSSMASTEKQGHEEAAMVDIESKSSASSLANSKHHYEMIGGTTEQRPTSDPVTGGARGDNSSSVDKQMVQTTSAPHIQEFDIKILMADETGRRQQVPLEQATGHQITHTDPTKTVQNNPPTTTTTTVPPTTTTTSTTASPPSKSSTSSPVNSQNRLPVGDLYKNQSVPTLSFANQGELRMSSLGKPCSSNRECQLRDPYSHCAQGICECLNPTTRCRANLTGCHKDTFQCRNGQCISWYFVCDQFKNCDDGSDEEDCRTHSCPPEAFQCKSDGICVTRGKLCNGKRDCNDGSDELFCGDEGVQHQTKTTTTTTTPLMSISPNAAQGDGDKNTANNNNNGTASVSSKKRCHSRAFTCDNGQCLPAYVFCNAVEDCADGSDENEALCDRVIWSGRRNWHQLITGSSSSSSTITTSTTTSRRPAVSFDDGSSIGHLSVPTIGTTGVIQTTSRPLKTTTTHLMSDGVNSRKQAISSSTDESPVVKTDRAAIEQLLASLSHRTPERRGGGGGGSNNNGGGRQVSARRSRLLYEHRQQQQQQQHQHQQQTQHRRQTLMQECPRDTFTCRNGKCRSSAILCSGVDGCGDNSDEDQCEVCQCRPPHG